MRIDADLYSELTSSYKGESYEGFEVVESDGWVVNHKYENKRVVVKHLASGKFYALYETRTGSHYSDYYYEEYDKDADGLVELERVVPMEKVIVEYV